MLAMTLGVGCDRPRTPSAPAAADLPPRLPAARVHWIGKSQITNDLRGLGVTRIWRLPESLQIEARVLDKLAATIGRPEAGSAGQASTGGGDTSPSAAGTTGLLAAAVAQLSSQNLRPMLEDLVQSEFFLEVSAWNQSTGMVALAIRLAPGRASAWKAAVEEAAGRRTGKPAAGVSREPPSIELLSAGEWTLAGIAAGSNALANGFTTRLRSGLAPFEVSSNSLWLEAQADLSTLFLPGKGELGTGSVLPQSTGSAAAVAPPPASPATASASAPSFLPSSISLGISGGGDQVITRAQLYFPGRMPLQVDPWKIPASLIREPLIGFSAARGFQPWLDAMNAWKRLGLGPAPNEAFCWSLNGSPFFSAWALRFAQPTNFANRFRDFSRQTANPWIAAHAFGSVESLTNSAGAIWDGLPYIAPFFQIAATPEGELVVGGLIPSLPTNGAPATEIIWQTTEAKDLLFYGWELTGARLQADAYLGQLARLICRQPQLETNSISLGWLQAAAPNLGNCLTTVALVGTNQLVLTRRSTVGFSSLELHLLNEWIAH